MKKPLVLMGATMAVLFANACSTTPAGTSAVDAPTTTTPVIANPSLPSTAAECTPVAGGIPATETDFGCLHLASVSGSDATGELVWLGTEPFTLATMVREGALSFSSRTPCNMHMSAVKVTDKQFVDPNMAVTLMACQSPQSDFEAWVTAFFSTPLDYTLNKDYLVLSGENSTVTFNPAAA